MQLKERPNVFRILADPHVWYMLYNIFLFDIRMLLSFVCGTFEYMFEFRSHVVMDAVGEGWNVQ